MKKLTPGEKKVYDYLVYRIDKVRWAPTIKEIAEKFGFSFPRAQQYLCQLEAKGVIAREKYHSRGIALTHKGDTDE